MYPQSYTDGSLYLVMFKVINAGALFRRGDDVEKQYCSTRLQLVTKIATVS